ncbi:MAG: hypothetical protein M3Z32_00745 [Acidobacteriota bacterium]|nr:hypothetical protein [Acidobacteriota bacterium]
MRKSKDPYRLTSGPWGIVGLVVLGVVAILFIWSLRQFHRGANPGPSIRAIAR